MSKRRTRDLASRGAQAVLATCLAATVAGGMASGQRLEIAGNATEPGLRLRAYWIGGPIDGLPPLDPSLSPNVDVTVADAAHAALPLHGPGDEVIDRQFVARWSGWLRVDAPGAYTFELETRSAWRVLIAGTRAGERQPGAAASPFTAHLAAGWQPIDVLQYVDEPDGFAWRLAWKRPDAVSVEQVPADAFRAPAFYFRPTQPGRKRLADGGDRPGLRQKLAGVHPAYRVTTIRPGGMEMPVGGLGMLPDGRLVVARFDARTLQAPHPTREPNGELWLVSNPAADDASLIAAEQIADGLFEPSGVAVVRDAIYVSHRQEILRFDLDRQSGRWVPAVVAAGWDTNDFHQISAGLLHRDGPTPDHPGFLFMARSPGLGLKRNPPNHGSVWRIDLSQPAGRNVTPLTGGHRTPNGLAYGPEGELFVVDNQGEWTPANELNHVQPGRFYGFYQSHEPPHAYAAPFQPHADPALITPAAVLLPQDEIANSPTQPLMFPDGHRFAGQLALPDMRYGGINRVFLEKIEGVWQGCVMRFTQGLEAGPNRILFGPDGALYAGGIGGRHASTWYWINERGEPTYQGLQRLTPTGEDAFEIERMTATRDGFELVFTEPVPRTTLESSGSYQVRQWTYTATAAYGGPKVDEGILQVTEAAASPDRRTVRLTIPGLREGYVVHLTTDPVSDSNRAIWSGEVWYTLNRRPR